jgi:tRNA (cmo5U34)-methyltransferase
MKPVPFDRVASIYDQLAKLVFGKSIREAQRYFLTEIQEGSQVLIIGGGTGWILQDLSRLKNCSITYLEASSAMLKVAEQHYIRLQAKFSSQNTEVIFVEGSVSALPPLATFRVIISFFLLDVYANPEARMLMKTLKTMLQPSGIWLYADFEKSENPIKKAWQIPFLWLMYRFFQLTTNLENNRLPDLKQLFNELELTLKKQHSFYHTFIRSAVYQKQ